MAKNNRFSDVIYFTFFLIFLIAIFLQTEKGMKFLKLPLSSFNSFFANITHSLISRAKNISEYMKDLEGLRKRKEELEKANILLKKRVFELEEELRKFRKAENLLGIKEFQHVIAETISYDFTNPYSGITINKGRKHGVKIYSPVLDSELNLVGRVLRADWFSSDVLLLTGGEFAASVKLKNSIFGIIYGENSPLCSLRYLTETSGVKEGEEVLTSGFDRIFPSGIKVGKVTKVINPEIGMESIEVKPYASPNSMELVVVLIK